MSILKGEELDNFVKTVEEIKEFLGKKRAGNVAIFASHKHAYFKVIDMGVMNGVCPLMFFNSQITVALPFVSLACPFASSGLHVCLMFVPATITSPICT